MRILAQKLRQAYAAAANALAAAVLLAACDPNAIPFGAVRVQGSFDNLEPAATKIEARSAAQTAGARDVPLAGRIATTGTPHGRLMNRTLGSFLHPRSLISQSASISAILAGVNEEDFGDPGVVTTTEVTEEGGFSVDVPTAAAPDGASGDYVMLAYDEALGVGVQQLIGFIELPAGADESSAGWPLGGTAQGTTVDLGTMGGDGGNEQTLVAASEQSELYDLLGADQAEVLFQAERDNHFKILANSFLNASATMLPTTFQSHHSNQLDNAINQWLDPELTVANRDFTYQVNFFDAAGPNGNIPVDQILKGERSLVVVPPTNVEYHLSGEVYGPARPLDAGEIWPQFNNPEYRVFPLVGPPPDGLWEVLVDGELDGVYDFGTTNPEDPNGNFLFYVPSVRLNVDGDTSLLESIELRFMAWSPNDQQYVEVPASIGNGIDYTWRVISFVYANPSGDEIGEDLPKVLGQPVEISGDFYLDPHSADMTATRDVVSGIGLNYTLGGVGFSLSMYR